MSTETSSKSSASNKNKTGQLIQLNQKQLDELIESKIIKPIKPLESEIIVHLNKEINNLKESLSFLSNKHDELKLTKIIMKLCTKIIKKRYHVSQQARQ